ncbi:MAG: 8-oxo-dGTP diphosphatase [Clostridia bacterium]|nr:8-oxo-dGTP diphosphatase [Clostridia bacterium]
MARKETAVFTNMCMVTDGKGNVLVQDRFDPGWPGVVFPGGHVEDGESFTGSVIREVWEETGIRVENPKLCGIKQFTTREGYRYVVVFFKADKFSGELRSSDEGKAMWVPRSELLSCKLVRGFEEMLRVFEDDELSEVYWAPGAEDCEWF